MDRQEIDEQNFFMTLHKKSVARLTHDLLLSSERKVESALGAAITKRRIDEVEINVLLRDIAADSVTENIAASIVETLIELVQAQALHYKSQLLAETVKAQKNDKVLRTGLDSFHVSIARRFPDFFECITEPDKVHAIIAAKPAALFAWGGFVNFDAEAINRACTNQTVEPPPSDEMQHKIKVTLERLKRSSIECLIGWDSARRVRYFICNDLLFTQKENDYFLPANPEGEAIELQQRIAAVNAQVKDTESAKTEGAPLDALSRAYNKIIQTFNPFNWAVISGIYGEPCQLFINAVAIPLHKSLALSNHSPDGFNWGYHGSGCAQAALAILLELAALRYPDRQLAAESCALNNYQDFKREFIAPLPQGHDFRLVIDIEGWLDKVEGDF